MSDCSVLYLIFNSHPSGQTAALSAHSVYTLSRHFKQSHIRRVCVCVYECVRASVRVHVRARVCVCVCVCVRAGMCSRFERMCMRTYHCLSRVHTTFVKFAQTSRPCEFRGRRTN